MPYKDKDKQIEASKASMKRYRARRQKRCERADVIDVVPDAVVPFDISPAVYAMSLTREQGQHKRADKTHEDSAGSAQPGQGIANNPDNYGQPDCECKHCQTNRVKHTINHGAYKPATQLAEHELNRA